MAVITFRELRTYSDLADAIASMSEEQRKQPIQCVRESANESVPVEALPVLGVGSVEDLGFWRYRSSVDNKYRADDVVIVMDCNPFSVDGVVAYRLEDGELKTPIYGSGGKTTINEQTSPRDRHDVVHGEMSDLRYAVIRSRLEQSSRVGRG